MNDIARRRSEYRAICHYTIAAILFSLYCVVVSHFFEWHSPLTLFFHTNLVFALLYGYRRLGFFLTHKSLSIRHHLLIFSLTGFLFASWYNLSYDLPWRDDFKFVFGFFVWGY